MPALTADATIWLAAVTTACAIGALVLTTLRLRRARRAAEFGEMVADHAKDGLVVQSLDGRILWMNRAYCELFGRAPAEMLGRNPLSFAVPPDLRPTDEEIAAFRYSDGEFDGKILLFHNVRKSGEMFWNEIRFALHRLPDGRERAVLVCRDATDQVEKERQLRAAHEEVTYLARHDALTGLANRTEFLRVASAALAAGGPATGMIHIDLDRFKEVNDTFGHVAGDAVVCHVADAIAATARAGDLAARMGGDEFLLVCPGIGSLEALRARGQEIADRLDRPLRWRDRRIPCSVSMGAALSEPGDTSPQDALGRSDLALYEAKRRGRGRLCLFDGDLRARHAVAAHRVERIRRSVAEGRLEFEFAPVIDIATGAVEGFEAVVRHDGAAGPAFDHRDFLAEARGLGLLAEVGYGAIEAALRLQRTLRDATGRSVPVGIAASRELFLHPQIFSRLTRAAARHGVTPHLLPMAIGDTGVRAVDGPDDPLPGTILDLAQMGFPILLDEFGTRPAAIVRLARLPVAGIKLGADLVAGLEGDAARFQIVRGLGGIAGALGLRLIAEGVDTAETAACLGAIGRFSGQGAWAGAPLPADAVADWLAGRPVAEPGPVPAGSRRASA
ncbi:EAL domain-containing protein [Wenxinia marina]|uniref:PAS domain S-box/diguanylate cyclase (GGDEF) domain protein n=1 Tax=Wenxinia marina DSM 24838 TaxID=1123501 RepID=A0A0D0QJW6_9RHOB|nr:EAL domain-containing protein [Wenxinia marina]KIQ71303.1 PAS domain S-box/diguanylate cyclase (GGDEF) domain protein [Wenxinia marina DSM 24838]GGL73732.1 GGDEF domain-containing protein [Wenxinia marina]